MKLLKQLYAHILRMNIKRPESQHLCNKKILLIPYDALGDVIMTVPLLNAIYDQFPNLQIEVISSPRSDTILMEHPAIAKVWKVDINQPFFKLDMNAKYILKRLYQEHFHTMIYLGERLNSSTLWRLSHIKAYNRFSLPFSEQTCLNKGIDPLKQKIFDKYIGIDQDKETHFCRRMLSILPDLGMQIPTNIDLSLRIQNIQTYSNTYKLPTDGPHLLFNPAGSQEGNTLSHEQIENIIDKLSSKYNICIFDTPQNRELVQIMQKKILWLSSKTILQAAKWITQMNIILTTDTSIGHLSVALEKPTYIMRSNEKWRNCCDPLSPYAFVIRGHSDDIKDLSVDSIIQVINR